MARHHYERLRGVPARFLSRGAPRSAHSALTLIFEPGELAREGGGVDLPALRRAIEVQLDSAPRFRQKIRWVPFERHPVWVDDRDFNLDYHLRHLGLPRPGSVEQLRGVAARIMAGQLGLRRPLWECWVIEGLQGGRFAVIFKTHHALATSGAQLLDGLLTEAPQHDGPEPSAHRPRPAPSVAELVLEEVIRGARLVRRPFEWLDRLPANADELRHLTLRSAETGARLLGYSFGRAETPLGGRVGPHRRFDLVCLPLAEAHAVRDRFGGSLHDVVLTTLTGAVADFLRRRFTNPATIDFKVLVPVPLREPAGEIGECLLALPIWESDPLTRYQRIGEQTAALGRGGFSRAGRGRPRLARLAAGAALSRAPAQLAVISSPWSRRPLYLGAARLLEAYGHAPLRDRAALGVSVVAYDGRLCWGLNADYDLLPDLDRFSGALSRAFRQLVERARRDPARLEVVPGA